MSDKKELWQREPGTHEIEVKGRKYRNLVRYVRPCATCKEPFGIYVSQAVADGSKSNNNFALKNCEKHRLGNANIEELEKLRMMIAALKSEIDPVYARNKELFEENNRLKAELHSYEVKYELGPMLQNISKKMPWET